MHGHGAHFQELLTLHHLLESRLNAPESFSGYRGTLTTYECQIYWHTQVTRLENKSQDLRTSHQTWEPDLETKLEMQPCKFKLAQDVFKGQPDRWKDQKQVGVLNYLKSHDLFRGERKKELLRCCPFQLILQHHSLLFISFFVSHLWAFKYCNIVN